MSLLQFNVSFTGQCLFCTNVHMHVFRFFTGLLQASHWWVWSPGSLLLADAFFCLFCSDLDAYSAWFFLFIDFSNARRSCRSNSSLKLLNLMYELSEFSILFLSPSKCVGSTRSPPVSVTILRYQSFCTCHSFDNESWQGRHL